MRWTTRLGQKRDIKEDQGRTSIHERDWKEAKTIMRKGKELKKYAPSNQLIVVGRSMGNKEGAGRGKTL